MKRFSEKVEVKVDGRSRPVALSLGGVRSPRVDYRVVRILGWWREPGRWWEGEPMSLYLRLMAVPRYIGAKKDVEVSALGGCARPRPSRGSTTQGPSTCRGTEQTEKAGESPEVPRIFELCRVGEEWYFHRLLA